MAENTDNTVEFVMTWHELYDAKEALDFFDQTPYNLYHAMRQLRGNGDTTFRVRIEEVNANG